MNTILRSTIAAACTLVAATAAHALPFEFQGTARSITQLANGNVELVCGSVKTIITPTTVINSPSRRLTIAQLVSTVPFTASGYSGQTGMPRAGFIGGTCVAIGDDALVAGQLTVEDLAVEIEENSLIGATTGGLGFYDIVGREVVPQTDARMAAVRLAAGLYNANGSHPGQLIAAGNTELARQQYGFGVDLTTVPAGDLGSADGYFGTDDKFYAHIVETTLGSLLRKEPRPSIQRAACINDTARARDSVDVLGGCVAPTGATTATVTVEGLLANGTYQTYGTAVCTIDAAAAPAGAGYTTGRYRFRLDSFALTNNVCPSSIRARTTTGTVTRYDFLTPDVR